MNKKLIKIRKYKKQQWKKIEIEGNINHDLLLVDVDLQKCLNCSFVIQKVDDEWFTINTGDKNCCK